MTDLSYPPVPQYLREMLKDYPNLIDRLQKALNIVVDDPSRATPPFEVAIWMLEGALEVFIDEARVELQAARTSGDTAAIDRAEKKETLMLHARAPNDLQELWDYFELHKEKFR